MKILSGQLQENIYLYDQQLKYLTTNTLSVGQIGYKEGNQIIHEINPLTQSVSLHIYSPSRWIANYYN